MLPSKERLDKRCQHGEALLEALIGMLLMMIIGLGLSHATARATVSQRDMNVQQLIVGQLRNLIAERGSDLCTGALPELEINGENINLARDCQDIALNPSLDLTPIQRITLQTTNADEVFKIGGEIEVGN